MALAPFCCLKQTQAISVPASAGDGYEGGGDQPREAMQKQHARNADL